MNIDKGKSRETRIIYFEVSKELVWRLFWCVGLGRPGSLRRTCALGALVTLVLFRASHGVQVSWDAFIKRDVELDDSLNLGIFWNVMQGACDWCRHFGEDKDTVKRDTEVR